jgi:hypothetical protein
LGGVKMKNETLIWTIVIIALVVLVFGGFGISSYGGYSGMMSMMYGNYGSGMMFFGWLYGILILVALVLFIIWLVKQIQK